MAAALSQPPSSGQTSARTFISWQSLEPIRNGKTLLAAVESIVHSGGRVKTVLLWGDGRSNKKTEHGTHPAKLLLSKALSKRHHSIPIHTKDRTGPFKQSRPCPRNLYLFQKARTSSMKLGPRPRRWGSSSTTFSATIPVPRAQRQPQVLWLHDTGFRNP
jgi:hypothetical protein